MGSTAECTDQLRIVNNVKKCLYKGVIVPTVLYG